MCEAQEIHDNQVFIWAGWEISSQYPTKGWDTWDNSVHGWMTDKNTGRQKPKAKQM